MMDHFPTHTLESALVSWWSNLTPEERAMTGVEWDTADAAAGPVTLSVGNIPADFPVRPLRDGDNATDRVTDNACGLSWDDAISTSYTPAASGRCPFEAFHTFYN